MLKAVIKSLLSKGMSQANSVILTGCSGKHWIPCFKLTYLSSVFTAGGLATYIHADFVHMQLPDNVKYHAIADAG